VKEATVSSVGACFCDCGFEAFFVCELHAETESIVAANSAMQPSLFLIMFFPP
jgi:hypothetical protein